MSFGGGSGGGGSIGTSTDVALNNPTNGQVLTYSSGVGKWENATPTGTNPTYANLPAGTTITVAYDTGSSSWPARPTSRTDIIVQWKGPDPSPAIVESGTGGMLDNVDVRFVTP